MTNGLEILDYSAIAIYLFLMAGIGIALGMVVKNVKDFFAGGNCVPWHLGAVSNYMTMMSAFVFVAHAGIAYKDGLVSMLILWSAVPATVVATLVFAKLWRRANLVTPVEYLEQRYNAPVRQISSWGGVIFRILDNMVRLYALSVFVSGALGCTMNQAIIACGGIVVVYTMIGGLWAVVVTDAVQCAILMMITIVMVPLAINAAGGFGALREALPDHFTWNNGPKGELWFLAVYYLMNLIKFNGNWAFIQRFYATKDECAARKLGILSAILFFVCPIIFMLPAIAAAKLVPGLESAEEAYVSICKLLLPRGVMGLMIAAMLAATMSTLSSEYNVTAGVLTKDIYQRLFRPNASNREQMFVARLMTLLLGVVIVVGATFVRHMGGAFEANKMLMGLIGIPIVIPLVFGVIWRRFKPWGAITSMISGVAAGFVLQKYSGLSWASATFYQTLWCVAIMLLSCFGEIRDQDYINRVTRFFKLLDTPVTVDHSSDHGAHVIMRLFCLALGLSGLLFAVMSLFSLNELSGKLTLSAGLICCCLAVVAAWNLKKAGTTAILFPEEDK
ncbi:MAG: Na+:solute symporter [Kiritimatiellae bacterium]|jgi:SSS family solute:Na+ symporter|nr:Na+:solute symporter [Kiritimatiellia bacterium]